MESFTFGVRGLGLSVPVTDVLANFQPISG